jgi:hypothetical protein
MASATPSSDAADALYDLWLLRVDDPTGAMDALSVALGDRARAREAVMSTPAMLVHGATASEVEALRAQLAPHGVTLDARPSRRAKTVATPPGSAASPAATTLSDSRAGAAPSSDAELGVAKVSYHAALVAAPAYVLQPTALLAIAVLTVLTVASSFGALTGSVMVGLGAPLAVSGLRFSVFALIVRRSRAGQTDLRLGDDEQDPFGLLFAGVRFVFVTLAAFAPFLLVSWSAMPQVVGYLLPYETGVTTADFVLSVLLLSLTFLFPLVALPGAYAATALGTGCSGVNPIVGLIVARRIPGPYFLTLGYLTAFWFASAALMSGGMLAVFSSAAASAAGKDGLAGALVSLVLLTGVMTVMDVTSTLISARVLGLLTYHYREELGL